MFQRWVKLKHSLGGGSWSRNCFRKFAAGSPKFVVVHESRINTCNSDKAEQSKYSCSVTSGNHTLVSDLTNIAGGSNLGMSPKELLWSAVGSCTAMTIRTYYERSKAAALSSPSTKFSGWADSTLETIGVRVEEYGDHPHVPSEVSIEIRLVGSLSIEQKEKLMSISKNCPVKKIMSANTIEFKTKSASC